MKFVTAQLMDKNCATEETVNSFYKGLLFLVYATASVS